MFRVDPTGPNARAGRDECLQKGNHYEKNSPYRSLEEKATLREVATLLIQAFPEFKQPNKDTIGI